MCIQIPRHQTTVLIVCWSCTLLLGMPTLWVYGIEMCRTEFIFKFTRAKIQSPHVSLVCSNIFEWRFTLRANRSYWINMRKIRLESDSFRLRRNEQQWMEFFRCSRFGRNFQRGVRATRALFDSFGAHIRWSLQCRWCGKTSIDKLHLNSNAIHRPHISTFHCDWLAAGQITFHTDQFRCF